MGKEKDKDYKKYIEDTANETAKQVVFEFQKKGLVKDNKQSAFQKTEILLYNYNSFNEAVKEKRIQIKEIKSHGIKEKSKSITSFTSGSSFVSMDAQEAEEEKIKNLEHSIKITQNLISTIDKGLEKLQTHEHFEIIKYKYFEGKTGREIAELLNVDESTISRNRKKFIDTLKIFFFSDDVIKELFM